MPVYVLKKQNDAFLTVQIGTDLYKIPLKKSLKHSEVRKLLRAVETESEAAVYNFMCDLFERFVPKEILGELTEGEMDDLFDLWKQANEEVQNMKLGESSASADLSTSTRPPLTMTSSPEPDTQ